MVPEVVNPSESPKTVPEPSPSARQERAFGPAICIASFALLGGIAGLFLLARVDAIACFAVVPGAVLGGLVYRVRARHWPIDPKIRVRRFGFALVAIAVPPGLIGFATGMRAQGMAMTLIGLVVGVAVAAGILVSGDRRPVPTEQIDASRQQ